MLPGDQGRSSEERSHLDSIATANQRQILGTKVGNKMCEDNSTCLVFV